MRVLITVKDNRVSGFEEADKLLVYNAEKGVVEKNLEKPADISLLEEMVEEYDPWLLFTSSISEDNSDVIEEIGVKVIVTRARSIEELIDEYFTGEGE